MSGIDGIEATNRIRKMENIKDVPIIAVTSYSMDWDKETLMKTGFDGLLGTKRKEFHFSNMVLLVKISNQSTSSAMGYSLLV